MPRFPRTLKGFPEGARNLLEISVFGGRLTPHQTQDLKASIFSRPRFPSTALNKVRVRRIRIEASGPNTCFLSLCPSITNVPIFLSPLFYLLRRRIPPAAMPLSFRALPTPLLPPPLRPSVSHRARSQFSPLCFHIGYLAALRFLRKPPRRSLRKDLARSDRLAQRFE